ncbi:MAG: S41 family peptidase [Phycisphaerales bacterium]
MPTVQSSIRSAQSPAQAPVEAPLATYNQSSTATLSKNGSIRRASLILSVALIGTAGFALQGCASESSVQSSADSQPVTSPASPDQTYQQVESDDSVAVETGISEERRQQHIESFEYVWNSVKEKHWDPDLNGVDWDQARADLLPVVENASNDNEARGAMNQLLERLEQSHFGIIPGSSYDDLEEISEVQEASSAADNEDAGPGWAGMNLRVIDDRFLVTHVLDGSPAQAAGVQTGWIVNSMRGGDMNRIIEVTKDIGGVNRPETQAGLIAYGRLQGNSGDVLDMNFSDQNNNPQDVSITLTDAPGVIAGVGELPPRPIEVETATLDDGTGYFRLNMFMSPGTVLPEYQKFVREHMDAPGIVIDMRGNFGGIILMAPGMINWLISEKDLTLGTMKMRDPVRGPFNIPLMLNPRAKNFSGKVAVLIDEMSISNAEILAAGLKDIGRGRLFGTRTAGLVLPSTVERLPNGDGFQYAFASYTTGGGYSLEGQGAIPDVEIQYTREGLLNGQDEVLEAAQAWIHENR